MASKGSQPKENRSCSFGFRVKGLGFKVYKGFGGDKQDFRGSLGSGFSVWDMQLATSRI